jgi:hypothetical protein
MAGQELIPGDPRPQHRNGKLFSEFLYRHPHLSILNALPQCEGLISSDNKIEESILGFCVVGSKVLPFVKRMVIYESKNYILTNIVKLGRLESL